MLSKVKPVNLFFSVLMTLSFIIAQFIPVHAQELKITGAKMKYLDTEYDIYNGIAEISNDIDTNATINLEFNQSLTINKIILTAIKEDGSEIEVAQNSGKGVFQVFFNAYNLPAPCGLRASIYDNANIKTDEILLGVSVKESISRKKFESTNIEIGPENGIRLDMSEILPGMHLDLNMFTIPLTYKHYSDGKNVLGIGWNSTNQNFWNGVSTGKIPELSHGEVMKEWNSKYGKTELSKLGLCWSVGGYAISYDDNPNKMSGSLQFYVGSGFEAAGQYAIFTYSITVTFGANGEFLFTIEPDAPTPFQAELNATFLASVELYGGIGIGCLASIGIYGKAGFGLVTNVLPHFWINEAYIEGEFGLKAKVFGRTILTYAVISGRYDFYKRYVEDDGTEVYGIAYDITSLSDHLEETVQNGYADQVFEVNEAEGETFWNADILTTSTEPGKLYLSDDGIELGDAGFSHLVAENVHPDSGLQVANLYDNDSAIVVMVDNNNNRTSGNKGEVSYFLYHNSNKTISELAPLSMDVNKDGELDTGGDYDPRIKRGYNPGTVYAVWKRSRESLLSSAPFREVASTAMLCFARYNETTDVWEEDEVVCDNNDIIIGDAAVGMLANGDDVRVFAYTNPANDPAGLSVESSHDIMMFVRNNEGVWIPNILETVTGRIVSFDAGEYVFSMADNYDFHTACTYSIETSDNKYTKVLGTNSREYDGRVLSKTFDNSTYAKFVTMEFYTVLTFMEEGCIYFANGYRNDYKTKVYPLNSEEKLPEAPYLFLGTINEKSMIAYLKSEDTSQNVVAYIKNSVYDTEYHQVDVTNVQDATNVNYFNGTFIGPNLEPFLIYTAQNYELETQEDKTANMYAQAGVLNSHASLTSTEVTNWRDIGPEGVPANISIVVKNNGLDDLTDIDIYYKDMSNRSDYTFVGNFNLDNLKPGETTIIDFELEGDYSCAKTLVFAGSAHGVLYRNEDIQSTIDCKIEDGRLEIVDAKYVYRNQDVDSYVITVQAKGPGIHNGQLYFYNKETLDWYESVNIKDLMPGESVEIVSDNDKLHSSNNASLSKNLDDVKWINLAARVVDWDEELDESRPSYRYRETPVLPGWILRWKPKQNNSTKEEDKKEETKLSDTKTTTSTNTTNNQTTLISNTPTPSPAPVSNANSTTRTNFVSTDAGLKSMLSSVILLFACSILCVLSKRKE